jgi:hypothetical protein
MRFELDRLTEYTDEAILDEIRRVAAVANRDSLPRTEFDRHAKLSSSAVQRRFGGWRNALAAAGLGHLYRGPSVTENARRQAAKRMSDAELLAELRRVAQVIGTETLTQGQLRAHSSIRAEAVIRRFGSWDDGLQEAGLRRSKLGRRYSEEQYFENLLTVWTHYGRQPRYSEMDKTPSVITAGAYEKRFGRWTNALVAFVQRMNETSDTEGNPDPSASGKPIPAHARGTAADTTTQGRGKQKIPVSLRYVILKRDGFRCVLCGRSPANYLGCELHVDHMVPASKGGATTADNLRTTCSVCNIGKGDRLE